MEFTAGVMNLGSVEHVEGCEKSSLPVGYWAYGVVSRGEERITLPHVRLGTKERARDVAFAMARHVASSLTSGVAEGEWLAAVAARRAVTELVNGEGDVRLLVAAERDWQSAQWALLRAVGPMPAE